MMATPAVVRSVAIDGERASEVRRGKQGDLLAESQRLHGGEEGSHPGIDFALQVGEFEGLIGMGIETTEANKEDLSCHPQNLSSRNRIGNSAQLAAVIAGGEGDADFT